MSKPVVATTSLAPAPDTKPPDTNKTIKPKHKTQSLFIFKYNPTILVKIHYRLKAILLKTKTILYTMFFHTHSNMKSNFVPTKKDQPFLTGSRTLKSHFRPPFMVQFF